MAKINPHISKQKKKAGRLDITAMVDKIISGDRIALGQAITLVESDAKADTDAANELLTKLLPKTNPSFRIGISGSPGAGKSTLIEALGVHLLGQGFRPAVLAVDPSSTRTGGSILGDKTRMTQLAQSEQAFIRPSPAGKTLGGVARKTRESILLLEAAGYDPVIVETVGVGQSETTVKFMTDLFILLISPGGGDEIQGIKRGIMELADILVINKADGPLKKQANETYHHFNQALHLFRQENKWKPRILKTSALTNEGITSLWNTITDFKSFSAETGLFKSNREKQNLKWFEDHVQQYVMDYFFNEENRMEIYRVLKEKVKNGQLTPYTAAKAFFQRLV